MSGSPGVSADRSTKMIVVVVVVECYCFLINIIVGTSEAARSILHPQIPSVA